MMRLASVQLALVALMEFVGAQSSGFLIQRPMKPEVSSHFLPVVSVSQHGGAPTDVKSQAAVKQQEGKVLREKPALHELNTWSEAAANAKEDAFLKRTWEEMETRHVLQQKQIEAAMSNYDNYVHKELFEAAKKSSCIPAQSIQDKLKSRVASQRLLGEGKLTLKQNEEKQSFTRRYQCMQQVPGDQSVASAENAASQAEVAKCMKAQETAHVALHELVTEAAVKQDHATVAAFDGMLKTGLYNTKRMKGLFTMGLYDLLKQMEDNWEKDNKGQMPICEESTGNEKKVVDVKEKEAAEKKTADEAAAEKTAAKQAAAEQKAAEMKAEIKAVETIKAAEIKAAERIKAAEIKAAKEAAAEKAAEKVAKSSTAIRKVGLPPPPP